MNLNEYFMSLCRGTAKSLHLPAPSFKALTSGKRDAQKDGTLARLTYEDFKVDIYYIESGNNAYAQQTLWLSFVLECEPAFPFSVYDILAFVKPDDFNCYTYSYVDSQELMSKCFEEISNLLTYLCPALTRLLSNGIEKNRLIATQKENINNYFGDKIMESSEILGGRADKIISMMIYNFFQAEIECAIVGSQALFFEGKEDKALKRLKKSKRNTYYLKNLLNYIENGGKANISETAVSAAPKKGATRHGANTGTMAKAFFIYVGSAALCAGAMALITLAITHIKFNGAEYVMGLPENLIMSGLLAQLPALAVSFKIADYLKVKGKFKNRRVQSPGQIKNNTVVKYIFIAAESLALILCISCANSNTVFYSDSFSYSNQGIISLKQETVNYSSIDYFAIIDTYTYNGEAVEEPYVIAKTKSGVVIDLYDSSFMSVNEFKEKYDEIIKNADIPLKSFKSEDAIN